MLSHYLESATKDVNSLIKLTKDDIADIKEANHRNVASRVSLKNDLIQSFITKKSLLDNELLKKVEENSGKELESVLTKEEKDGLSLMNEALNSLHLVNKQYAKYVVSVSEFYNSLLDSMFPRESDGYQKSTPKPASLLKVRV
jgi:Zn-dependent M32 family carboxypeptidase